MSYASSDTCGFDVRWCLRKTYGSHMIVKFARKVNLTEEVLADLVTECEAIKSKKIGGQILNNKKVRISLVTTCEEVKSK